MRTILLGPQGQLGYDIQVENDRRGQPLKLQAIPRQMLDLSNLESVAPFLAERRFECLINCSGYHRTDEVEKNAQLAFTLNSHLVRTLAEICANKSARFVHISTDYVFGGSEKRSPLTESDCKAPLNVYGASKAVGEDLALASGCDVLILRVASLFGIAGSSGKGGNFVETILKRGKETGEVRVVADQTMSPTATSDAAGAILSLLGTSAPKGVWHVVNQGSASWHEFASEIVQMAGIPAEVLPITSADFPTAAKRPAFSVLDNTKLCNLIGSMPPWQFALKKYLTAKGHL